MALQDVSTKYVFALPSVTRGLQKTVRFTDVLDGNLGNNITSSPDYGTNFIEFSPQQDAYTPEYQVKREDDACIGLLKANDLAL